MIAARGGEDCRDLHNLSRARVRVTRGCTFRVKNRRDAESGDSAGTILPPGPPLSPRNKGKWSEPGSSGAFQMLRSPGVVKNSKSTSPSASPRRSLFPRVFSSLLPPSRTLPRRLASRIFGFRTANAGPLKRFPARGYVSPGESASCESRIRVKSCVHYSRDSRQ